MLVASELIGNAVRVGGRIVPSVHLEADRRVTVRVWDRSPVEPVPGAPGALDEHGRGLLIVQSLSEDWGWTLILWEARRSGPRSPSGSAATRRRMTSPSNRRSMPFRCDPRPKRRA